MCAVCNKPTTMAQVTRATKALEQAGIAFGLHSYDYDPAAPSIGRAAANALGVDPADVARRYGAFLKVDLSGIEAWQRAAGFSLHAIICVFVVAACWSAWKLFSGYLEGRIFTLDAVLWLRRIGTFGLAAELCDIAFRPLTILAVTGHLPKGQRHIGIAINQNDLAFLMFLLALIALAHIFTKAAEIAQENEEIV